MSTTERPLRPVGGGSALAWMRVIVVVSARGVVATLLGFAIWAAGPALLGWQVTTVVSDSMQPAIAAGDVVAARPTPANELRIGQVLLTNDPDHADRLRLHRYDAEADDGDIITRGDANPHADSSTVAPGDALGVGVLRVPLAGQPVVWVQQQQWVPLAVAAAIALAALVLSLQPAVRASPRSQADDDEHEPRMPRPGADPGSASTSRERSRRGAVVTAALIVAAVLVPVAAPMGIAHAAFSATSARPATFTAAIATAPSQLQCTNNPNGTVTIAWQHPGGGAGFTTLVDGRASTTLTPDARSTTISLQQLFTWSRQTIAIRSDLGGSWNASSRTITVSVFSFFGLGSVRCA